MNEVASGVRAGSLASVIEKVHALEMDALRDKGDLERHEDVCASRYERIDSSLSSLAATIEKLVSKVENIDRTQVGVAEFAKGVEAAHRPRWWSNAAVTLGAVLLASTFTFVGWLGTHAVDDIAAHAGAHAR